VEFRIDGCSVPTEVQRLFPIGMFVNKATNLDSAGAILYTESFYQGCRSHDVCYQTCGTTQDQCDGELDVTLQTYYSTVLTYISGTGFFDGDNGQAIWSMSARDECFILASSVIAGLQLPLFGGRSAWQLRQKEMCQPCKD
jgi:hypothetical protein